MRSHYVLVSDPRDLVSLYLRAQNLEQVERTDEAVELYEQAVAAGFDAAGPYDRLIAIYTQREAFTDVARVADAAVAQVRTFDDKHDWYASVAAGARSERRGAEF
jgi:tetratricopeptide (TPR) repeat protein